MEELHRGLSYFGYMLKPRDPNINELFVITPPSGTSLKHMDIGCWGQLIIYNTPEEAVESLTDEEAEHQYVRLVLVATNRQLSWTLARGKELCRPRAALYMRLDRTCPLYHLSWEEG
ncbi:unnamed protein product, partial [Sphacelaria rigidula]